MKNKTSLEKVLLVDDDQLFFSLLRDRLARKGVFLYWARGASEALRIYKKEKPAVVITDVVMPKINGFELIRRVKNLKEDTISVFVILSDWGEARLVYDRDFLGSLGIAKYLVKSSYSPSDIVNEICSVLTNEKQKH